MERTLCHGFILRESRFIKEINAECLWFAHQKSGARLLKIKANDPNKTFSIGFKTFPDSDNGAPHILEHSVLNGSRSFPVKSPFDVLLKGSLSTFLNAFTSKDFTMYPVASMNGRDYFNLMHVYLDAVFKPLIYEEPRILKQEGWHHELSVTEDPVRYTGVVYNEMKGSFSNPQRELWYQTFRHLFPDSIYGWESGGTPEAIPTLTEAQFLQFHQKYYHPGNSYIFLYGDADLDEELAFIDQNYLSAFEKPASLPELKEQPPFEKPRDITEYYQFLGESATDNQTFLTWNFVAGYNTDLPLTISLDILCEALVNQESAPIRLALAEAGIGQDVSASSSNFYQHAVQIAAINANPQDKPAFAEIIRKCLEKAVATGLDKGEIEGIINRIEFRLREGDDAQKGLTYLNMALPGWFFADDPFSGLEYEKVLTKVKKSLTSNYLEDLIRKYFLGNPHTLILTLEPSVTLESERTARSEKALADFKNSLSTVELNRLAAETRDLVEYQQREDSPEALATIPMLALNDISREPNFVKADLLHLAGTPCLTFDQFTNDVIYTKLMFDMKVVPQEKIPWLTLLNTVLGSLNTKNHSFGELNKLLNIHTGGFYSSSRIYLEQSDDDRMIPELVVSSKATTAKTGEMFELLTEILTNTLYHDPERLKTVLMRHHSQLDSQIKGNGYQVASKRFGSYISNHGFFAEITSGLSYYWFITNLLRDFNEKQAEIMETLKWLSGILFTRQNLKAAVSCRQEGLSSFAENLGKFTAHLPAGTPSVQPWKFEVYPKNEGIQAASNVQYVIKGASFKKLGHTWNGKMRVLSQVLSTDWLQTRIRVIGGAYGGFASISPSGSFKMSSYRDPNLQSTLDNFNQTGSYLEKFSADHSAMTRYIIGTISELDTPLTASQKADQAFSNLLTGKTLDLARQEREEVLSATVADLNEFSGMVNDLVAADIHCVYGDATLLDNHAGLFRNLINLGNQNG